MATLSKLKPEQVVYSISREPMGNTTVRTTRIHRVRILEVHEDHVVASWNGNPTKKFHMKAISSWRVAKPYVVEGFVGSYTRLATREEVKAAKAEGRIRESSDRIVILKSKPPIV